MAPATKFYLVSAEALPEIFIKVAEAKRMLQSGEVRPAGDAARAVIAECEACASAEPFFRAWGRKESEIKLNRGGRGHRLTLDGCGRPVVLDPAGRTLLAAHEAFGALRLTVLTSVERPRVLQTTPAAIERVLRIASPAA